MGVRMPSNDGDDDEGQRNWPNPNLILLGGMLLPEGRLVATTAVLTSYLHLMDPFSWPWFNETKAVCFYVGREGK